ncbi:MAG: DUF255 domain-containing protein [Bacteroidota bacterium]
MRNKVRLACFLFVLLGLSSLHSIEAPVASEKINWISLEEALVLNKNNPKHFLIDLYTDWCGWCKVMDRETYSEQDIADFINENFYAIKFNAEQKEPVTLNEHTFKFIPSGRRGYHELAAALTKNQLTYPNTVFLTSDFQVLQAIAGYLKPAQMKPIIKYMGEGHYTKTPWEDFSKSFTSL